MATDFDRYTRRPEPPEECSPRVKRNWALLVQMQTLIDDSKLSVRKAARVLAKDHWRSVGSTKEDACVQWLRYNYYKFRRELRPSTVLERLKERNARLDRERPNWREEEREKQLRYRDEARKAAEKWDRDHPKEAAERAERAERAAEENARRDWHKWFLEEPKAALAQMLDDIKRDEGSLGG